MKLSLGGATRPQAVRASTHLKDVLDCADCSRTDRQNNTISGGDSMRKKIHFLTWAVLALFIPLHGATSAKEQTVTLQISGMTCGDCLSTVQSALEHVKGVKEVKMRISRHTHEAVVKYDPEQTKVEDLIKAVKNSRGMHAYDAKVKQK